MSKNKAAMFMGLVLSDLTAFSKEGPLTAEDLARIASGECAFYCFDEELGDFVEVDSDGKESLVAEDPFAIDEENPPLGESGDDAESADEGAEGADDEGPDVDD